MGLLRSARFFRSRAVANPQFTPGGGGTLKIPYSRTMSPLASARVFDRFRQQDVVVVADSGIFYIQEDLPRCVAGVLSTEFPALRGTRVPVLGNSRRIRDIPHEPDRISERGRAQPSLVVFLHQTSQALRGTKDLQVEAAHRQSVAASVGYRLQHGLALTGKLQRVTAKANGDSVGSGNLVPP